MVSGLRPSNYCCRLQQRAGLALGRMTGFYFDTAPEPQTTSENMKCPLSRFKADPRIWRKEQSLATQGRSAVLYSAVKPMKAGAGLEGQAVGSKSKERRHKAERCQKVVK